MVKETQAPSYAPVSKGEVPAEVEVPLEQPAAPPEIEPAGAGAEGRVEKDVAKRAVVPQETQRAAEVPRKVELEEAMTRDLTDRAFLAGPPRTRMVYTLNEIPVLKIEEEDTLIAVDELSRTIHLWKGYLEKNPADSLSRDGYLQIGIAYYLLAKITQDTTSISEGSKVLKGYIEQVEDKTIKDQLTDRVEKIEALRQK